MKGEFSEYTKRALAKRAGEKCSLCEKATSKPHSSDQTAFINLGEAAHIEGHRDGKHTRYNSLMSDSERRNITNGIWLCTSCHKEVDSDSIKYTVEFLVEAKRVHENKIALGDFDISWKEYRLIKQRIVDLESLIYEKEKSISLKESLYNSEINDLRLQLEKTKNEKREFENVAGQLKTTLASLDSKANNINTKELIKAFKAGNLTFVKDALKEEFVELEETELARRRLLLGNLCEIEKDFAKAEYHYKRAQELKSEIEFISQYFNFLKRRGKVKEAVEKCTNLLSNEVNVNTRLTLYIYQSKLLIDNFQYKSSISCSLEALKLLEGYSESQNCNYAKANIYQIIGDSYKNLGELEDALKYFQSSMDCYLQLSNEKKAEHLDEFALLFSSVARLYVLNNNLEYAIFFFKEALKIYEKLESKETLIIIQLYINLADSNKNKQVFNLVEAKKYLDLAHEIIIREFKSNPLLYLETYILTLIGLADVAFITNQHDSADTKYIEAINIAEHFLNEYGVLHFKALSIAYGNYAVFLSSVKNNLKANLFIDNAIELMINLSPDDHATNFSIARLFTLKFELSQNYRNKGLLLEAKKYIDKCSDLTVAKHWKAKIDNALEIQK